MARQELDVTTCAINDSAAQTETLRAAGTTGTDGWYLDGIDQDEMAVVYVRETAGVTGIVWIKAGDFDANSQGDKAVIVGGNEPRVIGPLEGARFRTSTGTINVDLGITGIVTGIKLP